ncbi:hypothetical protein GOBAR_AA06726 [Gossypium barbadense]|uniref:Transmembrane protein n=1 Tax=Gossypium barbadense TaxID=3634 RepID=A0A2P5YE11_GOSBA|nr:hypothetical protein GOBAR_AA06726 [Gossypium barbadense]
MGSEKSYLEGGMVVAGTATVAAFSMVGGDSGFLFAFLGGLDCSKLVYPWDMLAAGVNWTVLFGVVLWRLWKQRNQFWRSSSGGQRLVEVGWVPPLEGCTKVNCDGAVNITSCAASTGGVFRDWVGHWLMGFSLFISILYVISNIRHG